jgi:hypothetical protein
MIVTSKCAIKKRWNLSHFFISSPIYPHNFSFQTMSLYFLFDMSYNSSHLRTNSINFPSISEDKNRQHSLQTNTRNVMEHIIGIEQVQTSSDPFRHVKHSHSATATERNWDVTETFLSVWTSPFNYTWEKNCWTVTFRDGTETWRIVWIGP